MILHGSRSGLPRSVAEEYAGTVAYAARGAAGLGWNATIGDDAITEHMSPGAWGWNARAASYRYVGVEFAQARQGDPITDGQVRAFAWYVAHVLRRRWPDLPLHFPTHAELDGEETGAFDGKTDTHPKGDPAAEALRARIRSALSEYGLP